MRPQGDDKLNNYQLSIVNYQLYLAIASFVLVIFLSWGLKGDAKTSLPPWEVHPLPPSLSQWQAPETAGDYFAQIKPISSVNYLIWSEFPVKVYVDKPQVPPELSYETINFPQWRTAVLTALEEWNNYLPLQEVEEQAQADIIILRQELAPRKIYDSQTGEFKGTRARTATTEYEFYLRPGSGSEKILAHRMTVILSPFQTELNLLPAARHEIGHALGIWGHSLEETDSLYFSQVRYPPKISVRDVNTLKKVYEQPTALGWGID